MLRPSVFFIIGQIAGIAVVILYPDAEENLQRRAVAFAHIAVDSEGFLWFCRGDLFDGRSCGVGATTS